MVSNELRRFDRFNRKHILYRLSPRPPRIISYRDEVRRRVTDQVNAIIIIDPRIFPRTHAHASGAWARLFTECTRRRNVTCLNAHARTCLWKYGVSRRVAY